MGCLVFAVSTDTEVTTKDAAEATARIDRFGDHQVTRFAVGKAALPLILDFAAADTLAAGDPPKNANRTGHRIPISA